MRGATLIELIVALSVLGVVASVSAMMLSAIADSYRITQSHSALSLRLNTVLMQMRHELASAFLPSVEIGDSPVSLEFLQIGTAGIADSIHSGRIGDRYCPRFSFIESDRNAAFLAGGESPRIFPILDVDHANRHWSVSGHPPADTPVYWILSRKIGYTFRDGVLYQRVENDRRNTGNAVNRVLCNGLDRFGVFRDSNNHIVLELAASDPGRTVSYSAIETVALK